MQILIVAIILALLLALPLRGQIQLIATPEPMSVLKPLGLREIGLWGVSACNEGTAPVTLTVERIRLAFPGLRLISNDRARMMLAYAQGRTWPARTSRILQYVTLGAGAGTALAGTQAADAIDRKRLGYWTTGLSVASILMGQMSGQLDRQVPALAPWLAGLNDDPVRLAPGDCATRSFFAARMTGAAPVEVTIGGR